MGYILNKLGNLPVDDTVKYYIFLLKHEYHDDLGDEIEKNFPTIAENIGGDAIVVKGTKSEGFRDDVIEKYFGSPAVQTPMPSLLVTNTHPNNVGDWALRLVVPLRNIDKVFPNGLGELLSLLTRFVRGKDYNFLERFQHAKDIPDLSQKLMELAASVDGKIPLFPGVALNANKAIEALKGILKKDFN